MDIVDFRERGNSGVDEATEELAKKVIGAAIEVHKPPGPGLPETACRNAIAHEFELRGIPYQYEVPAPISYKGQPVGQGRIDLLVGNVLVVEFKVVEAISDVHVAQVISCLRTTTLQLGLIINFNVEMLRNGIRRVVNTK